MTIYFYLKKGDSTTQQPIYCRIQCGMINDKPDRAVFTTKILCTSKEWDNVEQRIKGSSSEAKKRNQRLLEIEEKLKSIESEFSDLTAKEIKNLYPGDKRRKSKNNLLLSELLNKYISDLEAGSERKPNGRKVKGTTVTNWKMFQVKMIDYLSNINEPDFLKKNFDSCTDINQRKLLAKYYIEFYNGFRDHCLELGLKDNSIDNYTKKIKALFNYLQTKHFINLNNVQAEFHSSGDNFEVVAIPDDIFFSIIRNYQNIRSTLTAKNHKKALDYIVFGGTVALRRSDMMTLKPSSLFKRGSIYVMSLTTQKTETPIQFDLPVFLTSIVDKNLLLYNSPLPPINPSCLGFALKAVAKKLPSFDKVIDKYRVVNGEKILIGSYPLHQLISPHMLRRTAVSNMLSAGVPVNIIKAVGGWSPSSKTFEERYLAFNQSHTNQEIKKYYEKIESYIVGNLP